MTTPTTLPDALAEIEGLRGQVRDLLRLLGQEAQPSAAGVSASPEKTTASYKFSEGLVPKLEEKETAQHLLDLHQMIETVPDVIFKLDLQGNLSGWNKRLELVTGFTPQELNGRPALAFVPEDEHTKTAAAIRQAFEEGYAELEGHLLTKDGRTIPYHWTGAALKNEEGRVIGITGVGRNVSDRRRTEAALALESWILESVVAGLPLGDLFEQLAKGIETIMPDHLCSILLMDADGLHLRYGAAPSLPSSYTALFDGFLIGPSVACCGTAAYRNNLTIVEDIASDPLWADFKDHALSHGLRACWSMPISSKAGRVLGTFAVYYRVPRRPIYQEIQLIEQAARLAQIAIERHMAEDQLRQMQFAMDHAMDVIYWVGKDAAILYANKAASRMLGYSKDELLAMTVFDLNPDVRVDSWPSIWEESRHRGTWSFETHHKSKDGRMVPIDLQISFIAYGEEEFTCGFVRDISERKQREQEIRESEEKLRQSLLASNTGLWEWNTETNEVWLSREWKKQIGYDETELPNMFESWESRLHPDDHDRAIAYAMQYRDHQVGSFRQEFRLCHKDGTYRWIDVHASLVTETDGRRVRLLGSHTDITERKQAEETLSESEARFRTLVANIPGAIYRCAADREWTMSYLSDAIFDVVGYPAAEFIANHTRSYASVIHPDDRPLVEKATWASLREHRPYVIEYRLIHANGTVRWVYEKGQGVFAQDGEVRFLDGAIFDISERKQAERTLHVSEEEHRALFEQSPLMCFQIDPAGTVLKVNRLGASALGYDAHELLGRSVLAVFPEEVHA